MKKVSIIVPVYNVEKYLNECVDSLINQKYENIEIILVNDGSKDNSPAICQHYASKYPEKIKYISQPNGGLPVARNTGIDNASGDYISFIDSDDLVDPDMYVDLVHLLESNKADLAGCNFTCFTPNTSVVISTYPDEVISYNQDNCVNFYQYSLGGCTIKLHKREIIDKYNIRFESKTVVPQEDYYFEIKYFTHCVKIAFTSKGYYKYRSRKSSITKSKQPIDYAEKCMGLIGLTQRYVSGYSNRRIEDFLAFELINQLLTSLHYCDSLKEMKKVARQYKKNPEVKLSNYKQLIKDLHSEKSLRNVYYENVLLMFADGWIALPCTLEKIRLKRLSKKTTKNDLFD